jgi:thioredoxin reductase (NADPH)
MDEVEDIAVKGDTKKVKTSGKTLSSKAIILCTGGSPRKLGVPGEETFTGKGVSYCATCDAPLFKGKTVAVVGGGSSAVTDAIYLSNIAKKVFIIHRRDSFRAEEVDVKKMGKAGVEKIMNANVKRIKGKTRVSSLLVETPERETDIEVDGVFIQAGTEPDTRLATHAGIKLDDKGFIIVDRDQATNVSGVFAAGDATGGIEQIATSVGQGCVAALSAYAYAQKPYWTKHPL